MCKQQLARAVELLTSWCAKIKERESILLKGQSYRLFIVTLVTTASRQILYSAFSCFTRLVYLRLYSTQRTAT